MTGEDDKTMSFSWSSHSEPLYCSQWLSMQEKSNKEEEVYATFLAVYIDDGNAQSASSMANRVWCTGDIAFPTDESHWLDRYYQAVSYAWPDTNDLQ